MKQPCVYILANKRNGTVYTGVTSDLAQRVSQHHQGSISGFTSKYAVKALVYYEVYCDMPNAIAREKQIKAGSRKKKIELIQKGNPEWKGLFLSLF